jgi:predicted butyrate kinase (DUF1464 family)
MSQVAEDFDATFDDAMAFSAFNVGDKTDAAIIVFVGWIVEALSGRHTYMGCHGWSLLLGTEKQGTLNQEHS